MKRTLLSAAFALASCVSIGQNLLTQNFDSIDDLTDWQQTNQSTPAGTNQWALASAAILPYFDGGAYNGEATSFAFANFNSTTGGTGTISNWLITPTVTLENGDVLTFYAIKGLSGGTSVYADRFEVRLSTNGEATANPTSGATDLGDFTTLVMSVNPDLTTDDADFPGTWTEYTWTVTGLSGPTDCKFAWRYFVTAAGPTGTNSDQIGLDAISIDRTVMATSEFFASNFRMFPNPASNVINLSTATTQINAVQLVDINGRTVKNINIDGATDVQINISDLNTGMYFLKVQSDAGTGTAKVLKN